MSAPTLTLPSFSDLRIDGYSSLTDPSQLLNKCGAEGDCERKFVEWDGDTAEIYVDYDKCLTFILFGPGETQCSLYREEDIFDDSKFQFSRRQLLQEWELCKEWNRLCMPGKKSILFSHRSDVFKKMLHDEYKIAYQKEEQKRLRDFFGILGSGQIWTIDHIVSINRLRATKKLVQYTDVLDDPCNKILVLDNAQKYERLRMDLSDGWRTSDTRNFFLDTIGSKAFLTMCHKAVFYMFVTYPFLCLPRGHFYLNLGGEKEKRDDFMEQVIDYAKRRIKKPYSWVYRLTLDAYGRCNPLLNPGLDEVEMTELVGKYEGLFRNRFRGVDLTSNAVLGYVSDRQFNLK